MYDVQLLLVSVLTAYLMYRCYYVCRKQRQPTRLYRALRDEDEDGPLQQIMISESAHCRPQRPETPPPSPWWNFDNLRPQRASSSFMGPAVHGVGRALAHSSDGPPPSYSHAANEASLRDEPPPTYQQVINLQKQESANRTPDT